MKATHFSRHSLLHIRHFETYFFACLLLPLPRRIWSLHACCFSLLFHCFHIVFPVFFVVVTLPSRDHIPITAQPSLFYVDHFLPCRVCHFPSVAGFGRAITSVVVVEREGLYQISDLEVQDEEIRIASRVFPRCPSFRSEKYMSPPIKVQYCSKSIINKF